MERVDHIMDFSESPMEELQELLEENRDHPKFADPLMERLIQDFMRELMDEAQEEFEDDMEPEDNIEFAEDMGDAK